MIRSTSFYDDNDVFFPFFRRHHPQVVHQHMFLVFSYFQDVLFFYVYQLKNISISKKMFINVVY